MDWKHIKKLMRSEGGKIFIVEEGAPSVVVLSFQEYERLLHAVGPHQKDAGGNSDVFAASFEAERYQRQQSEVEGRLIKSDSTSHQTSSEHIRLEDLPL